MALRPEDVRLVKQLEETFISELDRQFLNDEIEETATGDVHFDAVDGELTGKPDWYKALSVVMESYWEEHGR